MDNSHVPGSLNGSLPAPTSAELLEAGGDSQPAFTLLSGATGLLGQYLLKDLTLAGRRVAAIVRPTRKLSAMERIEVALQRWEGELGRDLARPVVLEGDVSQPNLGLSLADAQWAASHCRSMLHNAALVKFEPAEQDQEPWRTNLYGTRMVIDFCRQWGLSDLHYVSTAYVCGSREGRILETELDCGQTFRNSYEESKFRAEMAVREADGIANRTIYRPSIITADSQTGYTASYHGMMWYLRLFSLLIPQQPKNERGAYQTDITLPIDGDEPHDVVTVDWVSQAIAQLFLQPSARNLTYHVTADQPTTIRDVVGYCCEYFNSEGVKFLGRSAHREATSEFAKTVFEANQVYQEYETATPQFDRTHFARALPGFLSPVIDREMVIRMLEFGNRDRWGKNPVRKPQIPEPVAG